MEASTSTSSIRARTSSAGRACAFASSSAKPASATPPLPPPTPPPPQAPLRHRRRRRSRPRPPMRRCPHSSIAGAHNPPCLRVCASDETCLLPLQSECPQPSRRAPSSPVISCHVVSSLSSSYRVITVPHVPYAQIYPPACFSRPRSFVARSRSHNALIMPTTRACPPRAPGESAGWPGRTHVSNGTRHTSCRVYRYPFFYSVSRCLFGLFLFQYSPAPPSRAPARRRPVLGKKERRHALDERTYVFAHA